MLLYFHLLWIFMSTMSCYVFFLFLLSFDPSSIIFFIWPFSYKYFCMPLRVTFVFLWQSNLDVFISNNILHLSTLYVFQCMFYWITMFDHLAFFTQKNALVTKKITHFAILVFLFFCHNATFPTITLISGTSWTL